MLTRPSKKKFTRWHVPESEHGASDTCINITE